MIMIIIFGGFSASILYTASSDKKSLTISGYEENITKYGVGINSSLNLLETVEVSGLIIEVGEQSFFKYEKLKSISFSLGLKFLRKQCFSYCTSLTNVSFMDGLLFVGSEAFSYCSSLTSISFPSSITSLDVSSFIHTKKLQNFGFFGPQGIFSASSDGSMILQGSTAYIGACGLKTISFPENVQIVKETFIYGCVCSFVDFNKSTNLKRIENEAFKDSQITSVTFPQGIEHIGSSPFSLNEYLDYMFIPKTLKTYGSSIFSLVPKTLIIEEGCECFKEENGIIYNGDYSEILIMPSDIPFFRIPKNISQISINTLKNCKSLSNLTVDPNHETYSSYLNILYSKNFATLICCPGGVRDITVIWNCTTFNGGSLSGITINSIIFEKNSLRTIYSAFTGSELNFNFIIPDEVQTISMYCFTTTKVPYLELPESLTDIPDYLANAIQTDCINMSKYKHIRTIKEGSFYYCSKAKKIILPPFVETISSKSFGYCNDLIDLVIPSKVTTIADDSFSGCSKLQTISFQTDILTSIGSRAFTGCNISDLRIPSSVKVLKQDSFAENPNLKNVIFGEDSLLEEYQIGAFRATSVKHISFGEHLLSLPSGALSLMNHLMEINMSVLNPKYKSIDGILYSKDGTTLVAFPGGRTNYTIISDVLYFSDSAFFRCINLKEIRVSGTGKLQRIGSDSFLGCINLASIELPSSVASIESGAFKECTSLLNVTFVNGSLLTVLNPGTFSDCVSLQSIIFEGTSKLETISDSVFENAAHLESFNAPESLKNIGMKAFYGCAMLSSMNVTNVVHIGESAFRGCQRMSSLRFGACLESVGDDAFRDCANLQFISYCGQNALENSFFGGFGSRLAACVSVDYPGKTFGGLRIIRILDNDCQIPTIAFTMRATENKALALISPSFLSEE